MTHRLIFLVMLAVGATAVARTPFTKPVRAARSAAAKPTRPTDPAPCDTVALPAADSVAVAGFEKPLRSSKETMYVTNRTARSLGTLAIEITYRDMEGRMLHKSTHEVEADIPAGETRLVEVPSFDRNGLYYYHLSPLPARAVRATPFRTDVRVLYILCPTNTSDQ